MNSQFASVPVAFDVSAARRERDRRRSAVLNNATAAYFENVMVALLLLWAGEGGFSASSSTLRPEATSGARVFRESAEVMNARAKRMTIGIHVPRRAGRKIGARPVPDSRAVQDAVSQRVGAIRMRSPQRTWPAGSVVF